MSLQRTSVQIRSIQPEYFFPAFFYFFVDNIYVRMYFIIREGKMNTRADKAGKELANAIIEMVHLMYQNKTANNFYKGLMINLQKETDRRNISKRHKK
jgi:hypothetical protein